MAVKNFLDGLSKEEKEKNKDNATRVALTQAYVDERKSNENELGTCDSNENPNVESTIESSKYKYEKVINYENYDFSGNKFVERKSNFKAKSCVGIETKLEDFDDNIKKIYNDNMKIQVLIKSKTPFSEFIEDEKVKEIINGDINIYYLLIRYYGVIKNIKNQEKMLELQKQYPNGIIK